MKSKIIYILAMPISALLFFNTCAKTKGPYISMKGAKISETELKKSNPDRYNKIRSRYEKEIVNALKEEAIKKLFEMEAKSQGIESEEYQKNLVKNVSIPTPDELKNKFQELKNQGRVGDRKFEEIKSQLAMYMQRESESEVIQQEMDRLMKKYEYKVHQEIERAKIDIADEPVRNNPSASVVIVEFSDFECPFCARVQTTTGELRKKYGDRIKWVMKDFPLNFHADAMGAHIAANCVLKQNADTYWKFFDIIFAPDRPAGILKESGLKKTAQSVGADMQQYEACLNDPKVRQEIEGDVQEGQSVGVTGTPAFFINGKFLSGAQPIGEFISLIEEEF